MRKIVFPLQMAIISSMCGLDIIVSDRRASSLFLQRGLLIITFSSKSSFSTHGICLDGRDTLTAVMHMDGMLYTSCVFTRQGLVPPVHC